MRDGGRYDIVKVEKLLKWFSDISVDILLSFIGRLESKKKNRPGARSIEQYDAAGGGRGRVNPPLVRLA